MLMEILKKLEQTGRPVTLSELSRDLKIEPEALKGMLEYLNRKGKLTFRCEEGGAASSCKDCRHACIVKGT